MSALRSPVVAPPREETLDPGQAIIDAHHHLYDRPGLRYLICEYLEDLRTGHDIRASVFVQALAAYRGDGPERLRPVGETEFALASGKRAGLERRDRRQACAAIVGHADLTLGDAVRPVLEAHVKAGAGRFRGVRHITAWDPDASLLNPAYPTTEDLMDSPAFHAGLTQLAALGLSFDAWVLFPQLPRLAALARAFPDVSIVIDHCGGPLGVGAYASGGDAVFRAWSAGIHEASLCPNVSIKLSGLGMAQTGLTKGADPGSAALAAAWKPWIETCIEAFGPERAMFASNAPADRAGYEFHTGWNAMKRLAEGFTAAERDALFFGTAARLYRLPTASYAAASFQDRTH